MTSTGCTFCRVTTLGHEIDCPLYEPSFPPPGVPKTHAELAADLGRIQRLAQLTDTWATKRCHACQTPMGSKRGLLLLDDAAPPEGGGWRFCNRGCLAVWLQAQAALDGMAE
jgi:hypothetical protein